MRILLVEDDALLGDALAAGLRQAGFPLDWVRDGVAAQLALEAENFSAIVLDLGLPRLSGIELLERTRAAGNKVPILILTARDGVEDRVKGLDGGADDYVVKPVDLDELAARIRALVRRSQGRSAPVLRHGSIELDPASRTVLYRRLPIELSLREFTLLHELMLNVGRVLTRSQIQERLYSWGEELESNAIDVHVHHLRRKLSPGAIRTVRGVGYLMPKDLRD
jgi:two-component system OmpR family response regulator/two-component system response regulator QseB